jgi:hypothetical protein
VYIHLQVEQMTISFSKQEITISSKRICQIVSSLESELSPIQLGLTAAQYTHHLCLSQKIGSGEFPIPIPSRNRVVYEQLIKTILVTKKSDSEPEEKNQTTTKVVVPKTANQYLIEIIEAFHIGVEQKSKYGMSKLNLIYKYDSFPLFVLSAKNNLTSIDQYVSQYLFNRMINQDAYHNLRLICFTNP